MRKKQKVKEDFLFIVAADNYKNSVLSMLKYGTYKNYSYILNQLVEEFGDLKVSSINKSLLQNYIQRLSTCMSPDSVKNVVKVFKGIMENADEDWEISTRIVLPKRRRVKQDFYTVEEMRKLIKISSGWTRVLIMLLSETGCRIGEAVALKKSDIKDGVLSINKNVYGGVSQSSPKTDSSVREVCLSETLTKELMIAGNGYIFESPGGRPMWVQTFTYELKKLCERAKIPYKSPHAFRRGNITALILGLKIPENIVGMRVGHLSGSVTLGVYTFAEVGKDKEYLEKIEEMLYKG